MAKIVSRRAQKALETQKTSAPQPVPSHIFDINGVAPLTAEEQEEIGKIFEKIRKSLNEITG